MNVNKTLLPTEIVKDTKAVSLIDTPIEQKQILRVLQRTPAVHVKSRPGKGGGNWDYVTGVYVKKVLNFVFGFLWDTEIVNSGDVKEGDKVVQIWVDVKLTINRWNKNSGSIEPMIVKTQTGRAEVKYKGGTKILDYGNDRKAAITDGLKKCASELGIASDVYGKNEFRDIDIATATDEVPELVQGVSPKIVQEKINKIKSITANNNMSKSI